MSIPPFANAYAISASFSLGVPIGLSAVITMGPRSTPSNFLSPFAPNLAPANFPSIASESSTSRTITRSFMLVFPKMTFTSCGNSPPAQSSAYRTLALYTSPLAPFPRASTPEAHRSIDTHFPTTCSLIHVPGGTSASGNSTVCSRHSASTICRASAFDVASTSYVT